MESYDYSVTANSLSFPGPDCAEEKPPQTLRIITTGDAFTSAEVVDTKQTWPCLLKDELAGRLSSYKVEVLNLAITGYGPRQYTSVAELFALNYKPDLIPIGFFVNEYQDIIMSNADF